MSYDLPSQEYSFPTLVSYSQLLKIVSLSNEEFEFDHTGSELIFDMSHMNNHNDEIKDLNDKTDSVSEDIMSEEGGTAETFGDLTDLLEEQLEAELLKQQELAVKLKDQQARKKTKCKTF